MSEPGPSRTVEHTASWGRRIAALVIDWAASWLVTAVVVALVGSENLGVDPSWITLGVFFVESTIGIALAGGSFGQLLVGVKVLRIDVRALPLPVALARQLLVCLVIPPLVFRPDGRGLHDIMADSAAYDWKRLKAAIDARQTG